MTRVGQVLGCIHYDAVCAWLYQRKAELTGNSRIVRARRVRHSIATHHGVRIRAHAIVTIDDCWCEGYCIDERHADAIDGLAAHGVEYHAHRVDQDVRLHRGLNRSSRMVDGGDQLVALYRQDAIPLRDSPPPGLNVADEAPCVSTGLDQANPFLIVGRCRQGHVDRLGTRSILVRIVVKDFNEQRITGLQRAGGLKGNLVAIFY